MFSTTKTGGFPIGFRRSRQPAWQQDLHGLLRFAGQGGFAFVDFGPISAAEAGEAMRLGADAGGTGASPVGIGTVDLKDWPALLSPDAGERKAAVMANASHVRSHVAARVTKFLTVLVPQDPARARKENFATAVESYKSLSAAAAECGASILLEGAPGRPPHFANLACTPADLRAFLDAVDSPTIGVNYDPSHLARMGIDPIKFLREFRKRIGHVHAKDTLILPQERYEYGTLQQATFAEPHAYGGFGWRYVLPGKGVVAWADVLKTLADVGYAGGVSIELEDEQSLGDEVSERKGLVEARRFLQQT